MIAPESNRVKYLHVLSIAVLNASSLTSLLTQLARTSLHITITEQVTLAIGGSLLPAALRRSPPALLAADFTLLHTKIFDSYFSATTGYVSVRITIVCNLGTVSPEHVTIINIAVLLPFITHQHNRRKMSHGPCARGSPVTLQLASLMDFIDSRNRSGHLAAVQMGAMPRGPT